MVMLALIRLGDAAYGVPISKIIEQSTNREVLVGSVYAALERLEAKGFVSSQVGEPTPERGGRAKRYFRITSSGLRQVRDMRGALVNFGRVFPRCKEEHDESLPSACMGSEVVRTAHLGAAP